MTKIQEIIWTDVTIDEVLKNAVKGFTFTNGATLQHAETFLDIGRGRIAFKLVVEREVAEPATVPAVEPAKPAAPRKTRKATTK